MNTVSFVTNMGNGLPQTHDVRDGVTVREFLDVHFEGDLDDYIFSIRRNGFSERADMDDVLLNGDRVTAAPAKVKGE
jgi:hypothetical protein